MHVILTANKYNLKNDSQHTQLEKQSSLEIQIKSAPKKLQETGITRDKIKVFSIFKQKNLKNN